MFKLLFVTFVSLSLLLFLLNVSYGSETGNLFNDKGTLTLQRNSQTSSILQGKSETVGVGDIIQTGDESLAHMEFADGSLIHIQANTKFQIKTLATEGNKNNSIFNLVLGTISVFVNKITGKEQNYEVETPTSVASVRGTEFQMNVYVDEDYKDEETDKEKDEEQTDKNKTITVVSVEEGQVELSSSDRQRILSTIEANSSAFVTPDMELHRLNEFINLMEMRPDEIKGRIRSEIRNYLEQRIPRPNLPF